MITLAAVVFAASTIQPPSAPAPAGPRAAVQWDTFNFAGPDAGAKGSELAVSAPAATLVEAVLRAGGLLGGGRAGVSSSLGWTVKGGSFVFGPLGGEPAGGLSTSLDLPKGWLALDAAKKESAGAALTVDLNAFRSGAEGLFDSPWLQRTLDRLALDNARLVSIRAAINPPANDNLPPMLSLKAFASARSDAPGPARVVTLITPGWTGTAVDAAAVTGAHWAASVRFDSGGLGVIGRDGGVGTIAGLVRLGVDLIGTGNTSAGAAWVKDYAVWQERATDGLRSLSTRLQQRGTLGCYGSAGSPDFVLAIASRKGERADTLTKALEGIAAAGGITSKGGVFTLKDGGPLTPRLAAMVCDTGSGPYLVVSLEHSESLALLQQTGTRLRQAK